MTVEERLWAYRIGRRRWLFSREYGHEKDCYAPSDGGNHVDRDIQGAGAELFVHKYLGIPWRPRVGDFECYDVDDSDLQVRQTDRSYGHLILRPKDEKKPGAYILVTGRMPDYTIRGWIESYKVFPYYQLSLGPSKRGKLAYWVPQKALTPIGKI